MNEKLLTTISEWIDSFVVYDKNYRSRKCISPLTSDWDRLADALGEDIKQVIPSYPPENRFAVTPKEACDNNWSVKRDFYWQGDSEYGGFWVWKSMSLEDAILNDPVHREDSLDKQFKFCYLCKKTADCTLTPEAGWVCDDCLTKKTPSWAEPMWDIFCTKCDCCPRGMALPDLDEVVKMAIENEGWFVKGDVALCPDCRCVT